MTHHFGIISPPVPGHLHPLGALGRELIARGHRVTCFQVPDLERQIESQEIEFAAIGESDHPRGSLPESLARLAALGGLAALRFTIRAVAKTSEMLLRDGPRAIQAAGVDALLVDQMEPAGGAIAEHLRIPFITVCNALPINRDAELPPPFTDWVYRKEGWARLRNRLGYAVSDRMLRPVARVVESARAEWRLPRLSSPEESFSKLAQISQLPREFDFPRTEMPRELHYVGPLRRPQERSVSFPWERLNGKPLVYASLGTLQNRRETLFRCFAEACSGLDVQLVLSHGGGLDERQAASVNKDLPGDPIVVSYAPQLEILARARLTITHAGLNTVLDSLANGVPVVAVPITYEQPAIARRVEWSGAGRSIALAGMDARRLREVVREVLEETRYRQAASRMAEAIRKGGGVGRAADTIEAKVKQR